MNYSLPSSERLKSKKMLSALFAGGNSFLTHPLRVVFLPFPEGQEPDEVRIQVAFTASKRVFKKAVERNRIKRLMREGWRLHKHKLTDSAAFPPMAIMIMFVGKEMPVFSQIDKAVQKAINRLSSELALPDSSADA